MGYIIAPSTCSLRTLVPSYHLPTSEYFPLSDLYSEDGGSILLRNAGEFVPHYTTSRPQNSDVLVSSLISSHIFQSFILCSDNDTLHDKHAIARPQADITSPR
jgi:hypothetical protein